MATLLDMVLAAVRRIGPRLPCRLMRSRHVPCPLVLAMALALTSCAAPLSGLESDALRSAVIEGIEDEPVVLNEGRWEGEPFVEGGSSRPMLGLVEEFAVRGEFFEEGREDCAVLLWHHTGGTGNRLWLVILGSAPERPRTLASELIGDRVQVIHLCYMDDQLRLELIAHGPRDAACCPGQFERRSYRVVGDELVGFTEIVGRASTDDLGGEVWRLETLRRGDEEPVPFEVTLEFDGRGNFMGESGCNSYDGVVEDEDGRNVRLTPRVTSARRCPEGRADLEYEFLRRLGAASRFSFRNGRLLLQYVLDDEADLLTFISPHLAARP